MGYKGFLIVAAILLSTYFAPTAAASTYPYMVVYDTVPKTATTSNKTATDTVAQKKEAHSPKKAAIRSAIIPGWGQAYNKKYWKIPIVYGVLGVTGAVLASNIKTYNDINYALKVMEDKDTANYHNVDDALKPFLKSPYGQNSLINYRAEYRKNIDYSVLFILLFWGLNVVDATVDAHLKSFDVSNELSMKIKPNIMPMGTGFGASLVFDIHKSKTKLLAVPQ